MEKHTGSKTTVEKQKIELIGYSYMILSDIVVANADALGAAAPREEFLSTDSLRALFLSMAPLLLLLTPDQAQRNRELFRCVPAADPLPGYPSIPPANPPFSIAPDFNPADTKATLAVANGTTRSRYPPPPNSTIFSDPQYHEHVLATFISTAMVAAGYTPNSPTNSPEQETNGFFSFIFELMNYGYYLSLELFSDNYQHNSSDCQPLLDRVSSFIRSVESSTGAKDASKTMGSSSSNSQKVQKTLYTVFRINGDVVGKPYPVANIFWSSIVMEKKAVSSGKSTSVNQKQSIQLLCYSYMILSPRMSGGTAPALLFSQSVLGACPEQEMSFRKVKKSNFSFIGPSTIVVTLSHRHLSKRVVQPLQLSLTAAEKRLWG
ncbi:hypothetical protein SELMODRAFT_410291 [Selaginella moellendorffii]|uniref:Uncharacterized protein n=1 Tax=Selaginella moellendorffii TaxID=88036 RepID=D8REA3_SELML|nr:hypothetical protein SELMODRAFT_410291 [Selaginella moellendorffii]